MHLIIEVLLCMPWPMCNKCIQRVVRVCHSCKGPATCLCRLGLHAVATWHTRLIIHTTTRIITIISTLSRPLLHKWRSQFNIFTTSLSTSLPASAAISPEFPLIQLAAAPPMLLIGHPSCSTSTEAPSSALPNFPASFTKLLPARCTQPYHYLGPSIPHRTHPFRDNQAWPSGSLLSSCDRTLV
jgi:hypothetical protein